MNKKCLLVFAIIILIVTMISCNRNHNKTADEKVLSSSVSTDIKKTYIQYTTAIKSNIKKETTSYKYNEFFSYKLKDKYNSCSEIEKEKEKLGSAYVDFNIKYFNMPADFHKANEEIYNQIEKKLDRMYEKFTFNKEEIISSKKSYIDRRVDGWNDEIQMEYKYINEHGDSEYSQWKIKEAKRLYKEAKKIKADYENNKISLDKAIKQLSELHFPPYKY